MSFNQIYDIAGSSMSANTIRLNTIASNLANVGVAAKNAKNAYHALMPVFTTVMMADHGSQDSYGASVRVSSIEKSKAPLELRYEPDNPLANAKGFVTYSNVNKVEEMANMMAASRNFESGVNIINRTRAMQQSLLQLGGN